MIDLTIRGAAPDEFVVQISSSEYRVVALTNYGNIYRYVCGEWDKVIDIPFKELNKDE